MSSSATPVRYLEPGWFTRHVFNRLVQFLTRAGISVWGYHLMKLLCLSSRQMFVEPRPVELHEFTVVVESTLNP